MATQEEILQYWFHDVSEETALSKGEKHTKRWFAKEEPVDVAIKTQFEEDVKKAAQGNYDDWSNTSEGALALVILLDQFPRHIYRGKREAFSFDLKALEYSLKTLKAKADGDLPLYQRMFLYMPLMHSENKEIQEMSMMYYKRLLKEAKENDDPNVSFYEEILNYAQRHYDIIERFGRFPHRNAVLERRPTSDERAFAEGPDASFFEGSIE